MLEASVIAFLVMTGEDEQPDEEGTGSHERHS